MTDENVFERYPDIMVIADTVEPFYKIKYLEKVREGGVVRFERKEKKVAREKIENLILEIISN